MFSKGTPPSTVCMFLKVQGRVGEEVQGFSSDSKSTAWFRNGRPAEQSLASGAGAEDEECPGELPPELLSFIIIVILGTTPVGAQASLQADLGSTPCGASHGTGVSCGLRDEGILIPVLALALLSTPRTIKREQVERGATLCRWSRWGVPGIRRCWGGEGGL